MKKKEDQYTMLMQSLMNKTFKNPSITERFFN